MGNKELALKPGVCYMVRGTPAQLRYLYPSFNGTIKFLTAKEFLKDLLVESWEESPKVVAAFVKDAAKIPDGMVVPADNIGLVLCTRYGKTDSIFKDPPTGCEVLNLVAYDWKNDPKLKPWLGSLTPMQMLDIAGFLDFPEDLLCKMDDEGCVPEPYSLKTSNVVEMMLSVMDGTWVDRWNLTAQDAKVLCDLPVLEDSILYRLLVSPTAGSVSNSNRGLGPEIWLAFCLFRARWVNHVPPSRLLKLFAAHLKLAKLHGKGLSKFEANGRTMFNYEITTHDYKS